ncbi:liver merozoite formation protein [Plasmodium berghei]|uniref:Liver merozoite formation protein n=2 Tax=Plasmodium berghei TaxID=5821 RepID=PALM_PLABA|nr:liver merozoite formation protein [Plasmodium berghei ANKA]CXH79537.1 liver merozoite formation protein [Plasmodium berghei]SCM18959.1 liver merozoite formation protein [Plasmodium berghei]SCN21511.1 liver merozoite formation protein [Plasmodium berghei]SCO58758.1 liver merozoite formation protein [Plasmodium berghei]SCO58778.1 liver merozoite formation protein [Plasmodium berghei]|eukprot:XP_034419611.1 liver merozoite formation protein [Plasmodium berghei ANKA]
MKNSWRHKALAIPFLLLSSVLCNKTFFVDILNGINIRYNNKVPINRNVSNCYGQNIGKNDNRNSSMKHHFFIQNAAQPSIISETCDIEDNNRNANILKQYIYTLSHLTIFDIDKEKDIELNISLLLKACLASYNYIKNIEIYTSNVKNKEICSFIYENRQNFEEYFNLQVLIYEKMFNSNDDIEELLTSHIKDENIYKNDLEIYKQINNNNKEFKKNILEDILFESIRLNKMIQYSLAVNKFNLFSNPILFKLFLYFKTNGIYYNIFLSTINKIKYYYSIKNINEEYKNQIFKIVGNYIAILNSIDNIYKKHDGNIL